MKKWMLVVLAAVMVLGTLSACASSKTVYAEGDAKDKAVATADPMAKDILDGMQQDDFTLYSKDFDADMAKASTKDAFETMVKQFAAFGQFKSSELENVEIAGNYYRVNYKLTYESKVLTMGVVIPNDGTAAVSGLWFK